MHVNIFFSRLLQAVSRSRRSEDASLKSLILPMSDHPHTRNIKKVDNVTRYHQYKELWDAQKAPGEKAHKNLRWSVKENMLYHDEVVKVTNQITCNHILSYKNDERFLKIDFRSLLIVTKFISIFRKQIKCTFQISTLSQLKRNEKP